MNSDNLQLHNNVFDELGDVLDKLDYLHYTKSELLYNILNKTINLIMIYKKEIILENEYYLEIIGVEEYNQELIIIMNKINDNIDYCIQNIEKIDPDVCINEIRKYIINLYKIFKFILTFLDKVPPI